MYVLEQCQSSWSTVSPPGAPPVLLKHRQSSSSSASPPQAASVILKQRQSSSRSVSRPHAASVVAARLQHNAEERGDAEPRGEALGCAAREARSPASPRALRASAILRVKLRKMHAPLTLQDDAHARCGATHMPLARRRISPLHGDAHARCEAASLTRNGRRRPTQSRADGLPGPICPGRPPNAGRSAADGAALSVDATPGEGYIAAPAGRPAISVGETCCPGGGIGRRAGFRYLWPQGRGSSSLLLGTIPLRQRRCGEQSRARHHAAARQRAIRLRHRFLPDPVYCSRSG